MVADADATMSNAEYADHLHTYRGFLKGTVIFAAHALIILLLLYYFFG
jgi:Bacterial aa3 type cytochrome c oxidase subunit IV